MLVTLLFWSVRFRNKNKELVVFGSSPILNNKYWSKAVKNLGVNSITIMESYYSSINSKEDYDMYFSDFSPKFVPKNKRKLVGRYMVWFFLLKNAKIIVKSFNSFSFITWKFEYLLFRMSRIKVVTLPYGSDAYCYSKIVDKSAQNALLTSYPNAAKQESEISRRVMWATKYSDFVMGGFMSIDGMPRWDLCIPQFAQVDVENWSYRNSYSDADGVNGLVKILHCPNHRGAKGSEFIMNAVNNLKKEGLKVELVLLEKVSNERVLETMLEVDILAEQLMIPAYGLNAIEGLASGIPVLSNLENLNYTQLFTRYSFLGECPIVSTSPENIENNLRTLVRNPELRKRIGISSRAYAEKYHSIKFSERVFSLIFKKIEDPNIDIINAFHPMQSKYVMNNQIEKCNH